MKKYLVLFALSMLSLPTFAFEDYIITTDGMLTDIKIQHNDIINVYPLITVDNNKNTLIIEPLRAGESKFSVIKNNKDKYLFNVKVTEEKTDVEVVEGFGVLSIDVPPNLYEEYFDLDEPPEVNDTSDMQKQIEESKRYQEYINTLDEPPELRGMD